MPDALPFHGAESARPALNRQRIVEAAIAFIDEHGVRALTMRRLGAELEVEAMAVYRYLPSRDAVIDAVVETVVDELYADPEVHLDPAGPWQEYLQRLAHGVRRIALSHPQVFPLIATRPPSAPWIRPPLRSLRLAESFLLCLTQRDFSDGGAVAAYRGFTSFLLGHLLLEVAARGADVGPIDEPDVRPPETADLVDFPVLQRLEEPLSEDRSADEFEESLESLLERLGQYAQG